MNLVNRDYDSGVKPTAENIDNLGIDDSSSLMRLNFISNNDIFVRKVAALSFSRWASKLLRLHDEKKVEFGRPCPKFAH